MANFEYNFKENELSLIQSSSWDAELGFQEVVLPYYFNELKGDYIAVHIFDENNSFIRTLKSNDTNIISQLNSEGLQFIYRDKTPESISNIEGEVTTGKIFIKANELLKIANLEDGKYTFRVDFLRNVFSSIFTEPENYLYNSTVLAINPSAGVINGWSIESYSDTLTTNNLNTEATTRYRGKTDDVAGGFPAAEIEIPEGSEPFKIYQDLGSFGFPHLEPGVPYLYSGYYGIRQAVSDGNLVGLDTGSFEYNNSRVSYDRASWPFTTLQNVSENGTPENQVDLKELFDANLASPDYNVYRKINLKFISNNTEYATSDLNEYDYSLTTGEIATRLQEEDYTIYNKINPNLSQPGKRVFIYNPEFATEFNITENQHLGEPSETTARFIAREIRPGDLILAPDLKVYETVDLKDVGRITVYSNEGDTQTNSFIQAHSEATIADSGIEGNWQLQIGTTQIQKGWNDEGYVPTNVQANEFIASTDSDDYNALFKKPKFLVKEISNSRKEIRLIIRNDADDLYFNPDFRSKWESVLGSLDNENYGFDFVLNLGDSHSFPITNYTFDGRSETNADLQTGELVSVILRLNEALPTTLNKWEEVSIEKELITTQIQKIQYFSDSLSKRADGALEIDEQFAYDTSLSADTLSVQNYDDLITSASINENNIPRIISESRDVDNINIDFNEFSNHTIYGSVYEKVNNFYQKVSTLETYYNEISSSLLQYENLNASIVQELVANGEFTSSIDGWSNHNAEPFDTFTWSSVSQSLYMVGNGTAGDADPADDSFNIGCSDDTISIVEGRKYFYSFNLKLASGTAPSVSIRNQCGSTSRHGISLTNTNGTQPNQGYFIGTHTEEVVLQFNVGATTATEFYVDNVSIGEVHTERNSSQVISRRKELFLKIQEVKDNFTPYEKFLYYDGQSESTASAPNVNPINLPEVPFNDYFVHNFSYYEELYDYDGLNSAWKIFDTNMKTHPQFDHGNGAFVRGMQLFQGVYRVEDKPFFNYPNGLYFSYLQKGDSSFQYDSTTISNGGSNYNNSFRNYGPRLPYNAMYREKVEDNFQNVTESKWVRNIVLQSQSAFRPIEGRTLGGGANPVNYFGTSEDQLQTEILSGSNLTGSYPIEVYGEYTQLASEHVDSGTSFTGSILPSGPIFNIQAHSGSNTTITSSYFTDIKITKNDPTNALPFSIQYKTGSTEFDSWWTSISASAASYDNSNIHSIHGNMPIVYQDTIQHNVLYKFVSMMGDFFDVQKTIIDTNDSYRMREYNKLTSPPSAYLSDIADSLGWNLIAPFSSSLATYFGTGEQNIFGDATSVKDAEANTYRKIINNLMYIYKTKGTANAYRAILNIYGYPPDVLKIQELGGSLEEHNPSIITNDIENLLDGLEVRNGNISFNKNQKELVSYVLVNSGSTENLNTFKTDWHSNDAELECIEFVLKPIASTNDQIILQNSGSVSDYWNLTLEASGSTTASRGRFILSINNSSNAGSAITSNRVTCSTDYFDIKNNKNWNVKLNRTIATASNLATQSYELFVGYQDEDKITNFNTASLISSNSVVNHNFTSSAWASDNLVWGKELTGSISQIKGWSENLNISKFKQHILNKFSITGNSLSSSRDNLIYYFKLNEKYLEPIHHHSASLKYADSNPNTIKDYSKTFAGNQLFYSSSVYDIDLINNYTFTLKTTGFDGINDKKIISEPTQTVVQPLNPQVQSQLPLTDLTVADPKRLNSNQLQIIRSPQGVLNDYLINMMADTNLNTYFGNPEDLYKDEYQSLKQLHKQLFDDMNVTVDINKWMDAQSGIFSEALINNIQKVIPAKAELKDIGILMEPTLLERSKIKNPSLGYEVLGQSGSLEAVLPTNTGIVQTTPVGNLNSVENFDLTKSAYEPVREDLTPISLVNDTFGLGGNKETTHTNTLLNVTSTFTLNDSSHISSSLGTISMDSILTETATAEADNMLKTVLSPTRLNNNNNIIDLDTVHNLSGINEVAKTNTVDLQIVSSSTLEASHTTPKVGTYGLISNIATNANREQFFTAELNQFNNLATDTYDDLSKKWGRTINDVHFVSMVGLNDGTGSADGFNNVSHFERLMTFQMIGDYEIISSSRYSNSVIFTDYENTHFFQNRQKAIDGLNKGKEIGKTAHFTTESNGMILYPSNHINNNRDPFQERMVDGTQNVPGSKFFNIPDKDDLSTSSFYRIKITGENKLIVNRNKRISDDDGNVSNLR